LYFLYAIRQEFGGKSVVEEGTQENPLLQIEL